MRLMIDFHLEDIFFNIPKILLVLRYDFYVIADEGLFPKASINVDKIFR